MPRQTHHAHVVTEVLAAELRADADLLGQLEDLLLQVLVPEAVTERRALGRNLVQVVRGGVLRGLQGVLGARCRRPRSPGGTAAGRPAPSERIFSSRNFIMEASFRTAFVSW